MFPGFDPKIRLSRGATLLGMLCDYTRLYIIAMFLYHTYRAGSTHSQKAAAETSTGSATCAMFVIS